MTGDPSRAARWAQKSEHEWRYHIQEERRKRNLPEAVEARAQKKAKTSGRKEPRTEGTSLTQLERLVPITRKTLSEWVRAGKLKAKRQRHGLGMAILVPPDEVERLKREYGTGRVRQERWTTRKGGG